MSIADFVVLGVRPHYPHIGSECPRVEGDDEYTEMIHSLCFLVDCFDREGTAQEPNMEMVDKYVRAWMLNKSQSPGFVEVEVLENASDRSKSSYGLGDVMLGRGDSRACSSLSVARSFD
eukprot:scaffold153149_cov47-Attheya_sp.AAC.1